MEKRQNTNLKQRTCNRLSKHGKFGESFDIVINKLLDEVEKKNKKG